MRVHTDLHIDVFRDESVPEVSDEALFAVAEKAVRDEGLADPVEFSIRFVSTTTMRTLNRERRNINTATDVLSFPLHDMPARAVSRDPDGVVRLGDIVIAPAVLPTTDRSAHILRMFVHGMLHLFGMNDATEKDADAMETRVREILS